MLGILSKSVPENWILPSPLFELRSKRKSGTKVWKGTVVHGGCKEFISKMRGGWRRNGPYKTYRSRDWAFCQPCSPEIPQPMVLAQPCSPPCIHSIPSIPSRGCPHPVHCARLRESSACRFFHFFACKNGKSMVHYLW